MPDEDRINDVLSKLFLGRISLDDAAEELGMERQDVDSLIDEYDYVPSGEEVLRAAEIAKEVYDSLTYVKRTEGSAATTSEVTIPLPKLEPTNRQAYKGIGIVLSVEQAWRAQDNMKDYLQDHLKTRQFGTVATWIGVGSFGNI